ncbi:putative membrane protein [Sphingomonas sp. S17]|uniref:O-antigen ligase family protein n=2 Tax=Sphingomonas paucimobilis TaxID=13689 RepID=A0A411LMZ1_SPHPI|nr:MULTISPECIES: O-antigen ligase family protein [Sphingomonas]EGI55644.1 putative membrane protein [Sphingomonas sp. S17]MBQ1478556.1 O-antigen ligase family protein [Sphingomonas sp.]MCM3679597.1 O-antigen ligase family protein [Sphingomonas paucimobilis]MDG5971009.1 O-antigen ligase family protein [Sphingomonas paucimobilis]NNG58496.1 O-antigen ligase family protein [Sphingomonas paucimobilis]
MTATDNRIGIAGTLLAAIVFGEVVALGVDGPFLATIAAAVELVGGLLILGLLWPRPVFWRRFALPLGLGILAWAWIASPGWFAADPFGRRWSAPDLLPQASGRFLGGLALMTAAAAIGWRRGGVRLTVDRWLLFGLVNIAVALAFRHYNPDAVWGIDKGDLRDRFTGTFLNANSAACYFAVLAVLAAGRGFSLALDRGMSSSLVIHIVAPIALLGGIGACAITGSRTALLVMLIALALLVWQFGRLWLRRQRGAVRGLIVGVGVVGILLMVFAILGDATLDRVGEIQADWVERTELWDLYSRLAAAAPLGYGPGGLDDAALHGFASIHEAHIAWFVHSTHNIVLSLLITGGYPYLAIMSLLVVALLFPYFRRAHRLREPVVVALVAALAVIFVCASTDVALDMPALASAAAVLAGLVWGRASRFVAEAAGGQAGMRLLTNGSAGVLATSPSA